MNNSIKIMAVILLSVFAGSEAMSKAPECTKDGKKYGVVQGNFREEWYCYQERAESYLEGECYEAALADYEKAIKLRAPLDRSADIPGCDRRRSRSYGMHFLDWFGHRGRGITLYHLGRVDEALEELELSLQCTESSQAQFYLDKVRAQSLKSSGADVENPKIKTVRLFNSEPRIDFVIQDTPEPHVGYDRYLAVPYYFTLDEVATIRKNLSRQQKRDRKYVKSLKPGWGSQVISWKSADELKDRPAKDSKLYVLVESGDDQGVQTVEAGGIKSPYTFAQKSRADVFPIEVSDPAFDSQVEPGETTNLETKDLFTISVDESEGKASFDMTVTDLLGKIGVKTIELAIDREGPSLSIEEASVLPGGKARIAGIWDDISGIKEFAFGGVVPTRLGSNRFEVTAPLDNERVRFVAIDPAGNKTTGVIVFGTRGTKMMPPTRWTRIIDRLFKIAALDVFDVPVNAMPPRPSNFDAWTPNHEPRNPWNISPRQTEPIRVAMDIEMYWNELQDTVGLSNKPPLITLKTSRAQTVYTNQVYIEGSAVGQGAMLKSLHINKRNVLRSPRTNAFFNKLLYLRPGKNMVKIVVTDENGLVSEELLAIHRIVPRVRSVGERLAVSMLPFYQDPTYMDIGEVAYDNLATSLVQQRRFRYVDRTKVDAVVRELRLSGTRLVDPSTATRAGKLTSSEAIIIGVVRETPTSIEVKTQVVDVDSSRVMVTRDAYHQDKSLSNLQFITRGLAVKLKNAFPIVQGNISRAEGRSMVISLGRRNRVTPGMRVVFFKVIPKTNAAGEPVGADTQKIGEGRIVSTSGSSSNVQIISTKTQLQANDLVITK